MKAVYIILTFCAGLFLGYLILPNHQSIAPPANDVIGSTKTTLQSIDTAKQAATAKLQLRNTQLAKSLISMSALLADNKESLSSERKKVSELTAQLTCKEDSLVVDSLKEQIVLQDQTTDSIICRYEQRDSVMHCVVAARDSELVLCNKFYHQLQDLVGNLDKRADKLTADLNAEIKENKKVRFRNKLLGIGAVFISGIATTLYLKSK